MNQQVPIRPAQSDYAADAFTAAEFLRMMESGAFADMRVELVGGVIEKMSPAYGGHGAHNARMVVKLSETLPNSVIATDLAVRIDGRSVRGVDVAVARTTFPSSAAAKGSDILLAVEIADSTLSRDLGAKADDYARAGVDNYWVVDLAGRAVHVMTGSSRQGYAHRSIVRFGEPLAVPGTDRTIVVEG